VELVQSGRLKAGKLRNPVASGDLSVAAAWALVLVLLGGAA